jgi:hypothetical protein
LGAVVIRFLSFWQRAPPGRFRETEFLWFDRICRIPHTKTVSVDQTKIDFIGLGAAKSGSSWLATCMEEHPRIRFSKFKSNFFFNADYGNEYIKDNWTNYPKGLEWYLSQFPPAEHGFVRGEFGVSYLNDPVACERIKKHFPEAKLIVTLRNPVDMVYSLYWYAHNTVEIKTPATFEEAVEKEFYLKRGKYYHWLKMYFDTFPKENIHIVTLDDIKNTPEDVMKGIYKFLEVDTAFKPSFVRKKVYTAIGHKSNVLKNVGFAFFKVLHLLHLGKLRLFILNTPVFYTVYSKLNITKQQYPPMQGETRERLKEYYKEDIRNLEKLLNRDFSAWK